MKKLRALFLVFAVAVLGVGAGIAFAALSDTQTASGTITVSSESADLYICEPGNVAGPACGPDDSGADEIVFEGVEDLRPNETITWDLRLKNTGTVPFTITDADLNIVETSDPGGDCPDGGPTATVVPLAPAPPPNYYYSPYGVSILGKAGDAVNDNESDAPLRFRLEDNYGEYPIVIAAGDYEDVRLRLRLALAGTENCDSNTWDVAWQFEVN